MTALTKAHDFANSALEMLDQGFATKSAQKEANDKLNKSYRAANDAHRNALFESFEGDKDTCTEEEWDKFIQGTIKPNDLPRELRHVKNEHIELVSEINPEVANLITLLLETREAVKAAPIHRVEKVKNEPSEYQVKAEKTLEEIMERHKGQYLKAVDLARVFNGIPVYANTHLVTNQFGTTFMRTFYYMEGQLTPLNIIIAAAEQVAMEKKHCNNQ